ncbi:2-hydroxyglutaryl-CoA dehydratase [bacterium]|nr:2-hydroxyglutaryl-CoA dehydratase [FCB group bacterium]MBL7191712.1 2-hydroxyglutaryl-CoA dehydratase [bacterium]
MISNGKISAGIDIGSRSVKVVLWDGLNVTSRTIIPTGWYPGDSAAKAYQAALSQAGLERAEHILATGYGRFKADFADGQVTEITTHAKGISLTLPQARALIDIGGQDSKAMIIGEGGIVRDFAMNDRCAAGSGKFLEYLSSAMAMGVEEFAALGMESNNPALISTVCTVFAETEVLSLLAEGVSKQDAAAGVHRAIAKRVAQMAASLHPPAPIAFAGGVALNQCMVRELSNALGCDIIVPEYPLFNGALGAAVIAFERI